jgi:CRP-like cAMP-binding protein
MLLTLPFAPVERCSEEQYTSLLHRSHEMYPRSFRHREQLPESLNYLWKIESGYVRSLTWDDTGTIAVLGIWGTGDIVGHQLSEIEPYQIECLTPVLASEVALSGDCIHLLLSHIRQTEILLSLSHIKHASERLFSILEWLAGRFGKLNEQGCLIDVPLTHQSMAELIGSTRVTVTRTLSQLERSGKLQQLRQHRILLKDSK